MARSFGVLKTEVWEPGSDFRNLSPLAQWAYTMLLSQPQINNLGIVPYAAGKWSRLANGMTAELLEQAIDELAAAWYVLVDRETGELLVRTFVKHDKVWSQPKLVKNARRLIREVESDEIREYLSARHPWLLDERTKEQIEAYETRQETPTDTPSETPISETKGGFPPRARARGLVQGQGLVTAADEQELQEPRPPAAAELEAPRAAAIKAAADQHGADLKVVEPEANKLPGALFDDVVHRVTARCSTGQVQNPAGLLVDLLRRASREAAQRAHAETQPRTLMEVAIADAQSYARGQHPWDVANELLERKLTRLGCTNGNRESLLAAARAAYLAEGTP